MAHTITAPSERLSPDSNAARPARLALLAAGDLAALVAFVAIGRASHHEAESLGGLLRTAAPFVIAWYVVATVAGAFGRYGSAAGTRPARLFGRTALSWTIAGPLGILLRGVVFKDGVAPGFVVVTLLFNAAVLLGWRGLVSWLFWRGS